MIRSDPGGWGDEKSVTTHKAWSQAHAGLLSAHACTCSLGHSSHAQRGTCIAETMTLGQSGGHMAMHACTMCWSKSEANIMQLHVMQRSLASSS